MPAFSILPYTADTAAASSSLFRAFSISVMIKFRFFIHPCVNLFFLFQMRILFIGLEQPAIYHLIVFPWQNTMLSLSSKPYPKCAGFIILFSNRLSFLCTPVNRLFRSFGNEPDRRHLYSAGDASRSTIVVYPSWGHTPFLACLFQRHVVHSTPPQGTL